MNYFYYQYATSQVCCIQEDKKKYITNSSNHHFLNTKCLENGSTLSGRKEAFKHHTNTHKFIPIVVSLDPLEIYFPTKAQKDPECIWINYASIHHIEYHNKKCMIYFKDHTSLECENPERIKNTLHQIYRYLNGNRHHKKNNHVSS